MIALNHSIAEKTLFSQRMLKGELSQKEYYLYLIQEFSIIVKIEGRNSLPHKSLYRLNSINADMYELNNLLLETSMDNGMYLLKSTMDYSMYINKLSAEDLLPHVYINYLKLLYGGQIIKKAVPGRGTLYDFDSPSEAIASIRAIQKDEWADEANKALIFNINILNELQGLS